MKLAWPEQFQDTYKHDYTFLVSANYKNKDR